MRSISVELTQQELLLFLNTLVTTHKIRTSRRTWSEVRVTECRLIRSGAKCQL